MLKQHVCIEMDLLHHQAFKEHREFLHVLDVCIMSSLFINVTSGATTSDCWCFCSWSACSTIIILLSGFLLGKNISLAKVQSFFIGACGEDTVNHWIYTGKGGGVKSQRIPSAGDVPIANSTQYLSIENVVVMTQFTRKGAGTVWQSHNRNLNWF